ncbi:MAG: LEA type 2 family protein [Methylohalobius sp.]|nr:LEA type 2 family protein [Methylohalobius sp.]
MRLILLLLVLVLTGCADLSAFRHPQVSLVDMQLRGGRLLAQDFWLTLRIDNPNPYGFTLNGAIAEVFLNGTPLARGLSHRPVKVPAYGQADLDLIATVQTFQLLKHILNMGLQHQPIDYRIQGHLSANRGWSRDVRIPFSDQGALDFWHFLGERAAPNPAPE